MNSFARASAPETACARGAKRRPPAGWRAGLAALCLAAAAVAQESARGFWVPKYDEQGRLEWQIFGDAAKVLPSGDIDVTNLRLEVFENGKLDARVSAPRCVVNQNKGTAVSESSVRIERENMVVTGVGFEWDAKTQRTTILDQVRVVLMNPVEGVGLGQKP